MIQPIKLNEDKTKMTIEITADFKKMLSDIYFAPDAKHEIKKMILDDLSDKLDSFFDDDTL